MNGSETAAARAPSRDGAFVIPAYQASATLGKVIEDLRASWTRAHATEPLPPVLVVDDGSGDDTSAVAEAQRATVLRHPKNLGKGAALQTALRWAHEQKLTFIVTLDADGQHPAKAAVCLFDLDRPVESLVLGTRDLRAAGAPRANQFSNRFSNLVLSFFGGTKLLDTQSGLRRYPVAGTLELGATDSGFAFESDVVLRTARRGLPIFHEPFVVLYPPEAERTTHFHSIKDPARIVLRVIRTVIGVPHHRWQRRLGRIAVFAALLATVAVLLTHAAVRVVGRIRPPEVHVAEPSRKQNGDLLQVGESYAFRRDGIWQVRLSGTPEQIGWAHSKLLYEQMVANEGVLFSAFEASVPSSLLRTLVLDLAVFGYRDLDEGMSDDRRRELAAQARAFAPDPYQRFFPTYQRFVYLNALYDISLSFEYSPLIGCTTFTVAPERAADADPLLARAFDFEVDDIFDEQKAIFFVRETGKIPFASVAWPGLVGVVSGMNAEGLAIVVHGARAGETTSRGEPVVHALRRVLSTARTTKEAIAALVEKNSMVSHLVIVQDSSGDARAVERMPGAPPFGRPLESVATVTNHLEGPAREDPKNLRVLASTSTKHRRQRGDALVREAPPLVDVKQAVQWLRDTNAVDGQPLPFGDRRAIDAHIATHGVIMKTKSRQIWVSQSPHLRGRFIRFDLQEILNEDHTPRIDAVRESVPAAVQQ